MAHFAQLDGANTVTQVIVVNNADAPNEAAGIAFCRALFGADTVWVQTSYSGSIRKQFAGIGFAYDAIADVFVAPRPFPSWTLDAQHDWQPPVPYPGGGGRYRWDEEEGTWISL